MARARRFIASSLSGIGQRTRELWFADSKRVPLPCQACVSAIGLDARVEGRVLPVYLGLFENAPFEVVSKPEAARRQLATAISLCLADGDAVSIRTLASAALSRFFREPSQAGGTDSKLIWPVRDSPGDFWPAAHKVLDLLEIRFRYQICDGVQPWRALVRSHLYCDLAVPDGRRPWCRTSRRSRGGCARIRTSQASNSCGARGSRAIAAARARSTSS